MRISLGLADPAMPRTVFYDRLRQSVARNHRYVVGEREADLVLPAEDLALETNWPRYGDSASAFVRGHYDKAAVHQYLNRFAAIAKPLCIVSMNPFAGLPVALANRRNVIVAELGLSTSQRALNPRTISMPALPIISSTGATAAGSRDILASFRGAASHPCRVELARLHDGVDFVVELVDPANHAGRIDATSAAIDEGYAALLARSTFAFVPRGDALFSYRLLEVLSFGCIPVVLSDGWVLPFHRQIDWTAIGVLLPEHEIHSVPKLLRLFSPDRVAQLQLQVRRIYQSHFATLDLVVEAMLREAESMLPAKR